MSQCFVCGDTFNLHSSHDIPKYIGGKDCDGLRDLCAIHHRQYDLFLLRKFLEYINEKPPLEHYTDIIKWQIEIKKIEQLHETFRKISREVLSYYFDEDINKKEYENNICVSCGSEIDYEDLFFNNFCNNCFNSQENYKEVMD